MAVYNNLPELVAVLVTRNANLNSQDDKGFTPLMLAAQYGLESITSLLVENGADKSRRNNMGKSALDLAKEHNQQQIVELLERKIKKQ